MLLAAVVYMYVHFSPMHMYVHFCGIYPGEELLGLGLAYASYCQIIFQSSSITYTLISGIWEFQVLNIVSNIYIMSLLNSSYSGGYVLWLIVDLICISLKNNADLSMLCTLFIYF